MLVGRSDEKRQRHLLKQRCVGAQFFGNIRQAVAKSSTLIDDSLANELALPPLIDTLLPAKSVRRGQAVVNLHENGRLIKRIYWRFIPFLNTPINFECVVVSSRDR